MEKQKIDLINQKFKNSLSEGDLVLIQSYLKDANDEAYEPLQKIKLKNKIVTVLLCVFLGGLGAGRFYLGDYQIGITKIVSITILNLIYIFLNGILFMFIGLFLSTITIVWYFTEIFSCYKHCSELNYERIKAVIKVSKAEYEIKLLKQNQN